MNAQELRIGNWVKLPEYRKEVSDGVYGEYAQITAWGASEMCHWKAPTASLGGGIVHSGDYAKDLQPIPITPAILEAAGFKTYHTTLLYHNGNELMPYVNHIDAKGDNYCLRYKEWVSAEFKYLHQLQNMFYILVGKELSITL